MEEKLRQFKNRRRKEIMISKSKTFLRGIYEKLTVGKETQPQTPESECPLVDDSSVGESSQVSYAGQETSVLSDTTLNSSDISSLLAKISWINVFLYLTLWVIFYMIAIQLEFGFVYLVLSGLVFIYFNTRTGPKKSGEMSAYSVFNPGCEAIEGTLKAEQLEREFNLIQH